jgi:ADP-heptose:LPS heptosyltransferase
MTSSHTNAALIASEASLRLAEFRERRKAGTLFATDASRLALDAANSLFNYHHAAQDYLRDAVTLLCEMTALEDCSLAQAGLEGLFAGLIERLNDAFEPAYSELYDRAFAQVIAFSRDLLEAQAFDDALRRFGLLSEQDLLDRKAKLRQRTPARERELEAVKKVLLLSRVTLGADVAVTSVMLKRLEQALPCAEFVLLGSRKLKQLFGGDPRLKIREIQYQRGGGMMARLNSWLAVVEAVEDEQRDLKPGELMVVDPDSRLTQLGLLPVIEDEPSYYFFESRRYRRANAEQLSLLAAHWVNDLVGTSDRAFPYLALLPEHQRFGQELCCKLRRAGATHLVSMSLGVGGNLRKRLTGSFEENLIRGLLADSTLILDKGGSEDEREQVNRLVAAIKSQGKMVVEVDERGSDAMLGRETIRADIVTWDGGIGSFAALVAGSDEYIGYDSAGQHIAAALRVPTLTIFANTDSPLFAERWRPYGPGIIEVVNFDPSSLVKKAGTLNEILERVLVTHHRLSKNSS